MQFPAVINSSMLLDLLLSQSPVKQTFGWQSRHNSFQRLKAKENFIEKRSRVGRMCQYKTYWLGAAVRKQRDSLQVLQIIHPVNIIMQCTRSQQKLNVWEVLPKYCGKSNHGNCTKLALNITEHKGTIDIFLILKYCKKLLHMAHNTFLHTYI